MALAWTSSDVAERALRTCHPLPTSLFGCANAWNVTLAIRQARTISADWQRTASNPTYHGGIPLPDGDNCVNDPAVLDALKRAMDYWFAHDYTNETRIAFGGLSQCPCGTPGLWNSNWNSNAGVIPLLPDYQSRARPDVQNL